MSSHVVAPTAQDLGTQTIVFMETTGFQTTTTAKAGGQGTAQLAASDTVFSTSTLPTKKPLKRAKADHDLQRANLTQRLPNGSKAYEHR